MRPRQAELDLISETPRRPLRRAPGRDQHDHADDENLTPEDLGCGQSVAPDGAFRHQRNDLLLSTQGDLSADRRLGGSGVRILTWESVGDGSIALRGEAMRRAGRRCWFFAEHALKLSTMSSLNAVSLTDHSGVVAARPRADMDGVLTLLQTSKGDKKRQERWLTVVEPLGRHQCDRYVLVEVYRLVVCGLLIYVDDD